MARRPPKRPEWAGEGTVGILSYGVCVPPMRLAVEETLGVWENNALKILKEQLLVSERVVLSPDEDTVTMALQAGRQALDRWRGEHRRIGGFYLGTCTNPYDSRPSSTILAEALASSLTMDCMDVQFSTKSGSAALQVARAMVLSGSVERAMAFGSDTMNRHTAPGTFQEYVASAAAGALLVGRASDGAIAEIGPFYSVVSDLSDGFRMDGERYLRSGGLSALESGIGLFRHVSRAVQGFLKKYDAKPEDFDFVVFQQPAGVVPVALTMRLGFSMEQTMPGVTAYELGDVGSSSTLIGLSLILDQAMPGQKILVASYGFGAGADVTVVTTTDRIADYPRTAPTVDEQIKNKRLVDYATAMKYEGKYMKVSHALSAWL